MSTTPLTPTLSEAARHLIYPSGIERSAYPHLRPMLKEMGVDHDPWQRGFSTISLGLDAGGKYASTVGGVSASIPRQVGKTFTIGSLVVALCIKFPGTRVIWTAHRTRTTTNTFRSMQSFVKRAKVAPYLAEGGGIRTANGEQEISFRNGSLILFGAREQGFGRGFDEIDFLVFDEAQILTIKALEDMVAATNQARHPHGALIFFVGTPPRPSDPGEMFTAKRVKALAGKLKNGVYVELSADPDSSPDDHGQWGKANPSYPTRTPHESMLRLRENLPDEASWRREALGIWDESEDALPLISADDWRDLAVDAAPSEGIKSFGVKFSPDGSRVAVIGAMKRGDGSIHLEIVGAHSGSMAGGTASLAQWLADRWRDTAAIVIDGKSHAGAFVNALHEAGVSKRAIVTPTWPEVATGNAMLLQAVHDRTITNLGTEGQQILADSVTGCGKKMHGESGAWSFASLTPDGDDVPAQAASLAHWGAKTSKRRPGRTQTGRVM